MYSAQPNGAEGATINPAALNSADLNRGIKRSRSPESYRDTLQTGPADDDKPRKRGRPMKGRSGGSLDEPPGQAPIPTPAPPSAPTSASAPAPAPAPQAMPPQTPQSASMPLPLQSPQQYAPPPATPSQASPPPPKPTPKSTLKALPTVRDHTTDQLAPGGDEYLPRETDEAGEKKVMPNGQLLGGREYRCRTFLVQNRGEKLFMLATECARVLGYRDSYLLFNKNRSLYKIIANQVEKDDLVNQEVLPFSYRSRQIAIVTARSMFRQFGSRVINHGRRVRDDYWEAKARKQGFTENDLAGEKRPGAAKAREAAMEASQNTPILGAPHGEIVYSNTPGQFGGAPQAPLVQPDYNDTRTRDYSNILKAPRQEITGPAYQDRTQPAPIPELHAQAHHAAEFNRGINHQREMRGEYLQGMWRRPHEQPVQSQPSLAQPIGATADSSAASGTPAGGRAGQHPGQHHSSAPPGGLPQAPSQPPAPGVPSGQSPQLMMTAPPYSQPLTSQTQMQPARLGSSGSLQQGAQPYSYPQSSQMWQQAPQTPQYSYSHPSQAHQSPHQPPQQHQQQQPSQPPSQQQQQQQPHSQQSSQPPPPPPSIRQQPGAPGGQVQQGSMPYSGIPGMTQGYTTAASGHGMSYDQTPRQYMHQSPAPAPPPVTQSWSGQAQASQWWPNQPQ